MVATAPPIRPRTRVRRRRLVVLVAVAAAAAFAVGLAKGGEPASEERASTPGVFVFKAAGRTVLRVDAGGAADTGDLRRTLAVAAERSLRRNLVIRRDGSEIRYRLDVDRALVLAAQRGTKGGEIEVPATAVSSRVEAPVLAQKLRNNCESAALEILLATRGVDTEQLDLQRQLPRNGPLDPIDRGGTRIWGDPRLGYVGRADGGGVAGGFGVYEDPVRKVAAMRGVVLKDMSGSPLATVRDHLLEGRAVMVWIGLGPGPYGRWQSPTGAPVQVNFNEHTVVLTGVRRNGDFEVVNPLEGTREVWSASRLEAARELLDRRALAA